MWTIFIIIVIVVISLYVSFAKGIDKVKDNTINNFDENKWWTMGMLADIYNKKHNKK